MPGNIWDVEWFNQNAERNYPIVDDASRADTSGGFNLPNDLIVDLRLSIHALSIDPSKFYIGSVSAFSHGFVITVNYDAGEVVGTVSVLTSTHTQNKAYVLNNVATSSNFFDITGMMTIGSLETMAQYGGSYNFDLANTRLNPAVIVPDIRAVTGLRVQNAGGEPSELIQGDVTLVAGPNIQFSVVGTSIYVSAVGNVDYTGACECSNGEAGNPIKTINGVGPGADGNIQLTPATDCLSITTDAPNHAIGFTDTCCAPCCGCTELEVITRELKVVQAQLNNLENYKDILQQSLSQILALIATVNTGDIA